MRPSCCRPCAASARSRASTSGVPRPIGCSTWSRPTPPSPSSPTFPRRTRTTRGSPRSGLCSTPPHSSSRRPTTRGTRPTRTPRRGRSWSLVYGLPLIVRIARAANVPLPPSQGLPDLSARAAASAPDIAVTRAEYDAALDGLGCRPRRPAGPPRRGVAPVCPPPVRLRAGDPRPGGPHRGLARALDDGPSGRRRPAALPAPPAAPRGLVDAGAAAGTGTGRRRLPTGG